jgi:hypothetical protein
MNAVMKCWLRFLLCLPLALPAAETPRWTTVEGHRLRAEFAAMAGDRVGLWVDGKPLLVPLSRLSPASVEQAQQLARTPPKPGPPSPPPAPARTHFFDEATHRYVIVTGDESGPVAVTIFGSGAGYFFRWQGEGQRAAAVKPGERNRERMLSFSQIVGEGGERGTGFTGIDRESKLEIRFAEGERDPQDAGINGTYERISAEKAVALAKKELKEGAAALDQILRNAPRAWPGPDRRAAGEWEDRWPILRDRWVKLAFPPAAFVAPGDSKSLEPHLDFWIAQLEAAGTGYGLIAGSTFEEDAVEGWDGEYDDGFGGHVSLRGGADQSLSFSLSCYRGNSLEPETAELTGRIPAASVRRESGGVLTATHTHQPAEPLPGIPPVKLTFRKAAHFLIVETEDALAYTGSAWFDGVYRWYPVPVE